MKYVFAISMSLIAIIVVAVMAPMELPLHADILVAVSAAIIVMLSIYTVVTPLSDTELQAISEQVMPERSMADMCRATMAMTPTLRDQLPEPPAEITLDLEPTLTEFIAAHCDGDHPVEGTGLTVAEAYALHTRYVAGNAELGVLYTI